MNCLLHQLLDIFQFNCLKLIVNYCIKHWALCVNNLWILWAMIYILSWTTKKRLKKKLSRPLHSKLKKIQGLPLKFKDFSRPCEPCDWSFKQEAGCIIYRSDLCCERTTWSCFCFKDEHKSEKDFKIKYNMYRFWNEVSVRYVR